MLNRRAETSFLPSQAQAPVSGLQFGLHRWRLPFRLCPRLKLGFAAQLFSRGNQIPLKLRASKALLLLRRSRYSSAQDCGWGKQRGCHRAHCRVLCKPKINFKVCGTTTAAGAGLRFKSTGVTSDLSSFPPVERTKLNKAFQGRIQSNLCHLVMQARQEDCKMEKMLFPSPIK